MRFAMIFQRNFDPEGMPNSQAGQIANITLYQTWAAVFPQEFQAMFTDVGWLNDPSAQTMIPPPAAKARRTQVPQTLDVDPFSYPDLRDSGREIQEVVDTYQRQMDELGIRLKMGSYAWAISGDKTATGNPMLYSGPQMGFSLPAIVTEGSVRGGGLEVSGMHVPLIPGIAVGRTNIAGEEPMQVPIFHTHHGPVINPLPFDPSNPPETVVSWAYANRGHELEMTEVMLKLAMAESIAGVTEAAEQGGVSMHVCYVDRDGNIAYWMSGWDPIRQPHSIPLFPQPGDGNHEWTGERRPLAHAVNPAQGYFGGWNNKASYDYMNAPNSASAYYGPFHRAHVIEEYLSAHDDLTFEEVRDLALNIATTDSFRGGGNTWPFVADFFKAAVAANPTDDRNAAIDMLDAWDGHFVAGGPAAWRFGPDRADAWVLQDAWIREVLRITFEDEYRAAGLDWHFLPMYSHFDVLIRALQGGDAALPTFYDWFQDAAGTGDKPVGAEAIIIRALDNVIEHLGLGPYGAPRGEISFGHQVLGSLLDPILGSNFGDLHQIPYSSRSTYAQVVEMGPTGPVRIESMFPLGASGMLWFNGTFYPDTDPNMFTMAPAYDPFMPRPFPTFD
jgi:penicillin amidase